jgi:hypothetical protein
MPKRQSLNIVAMTQMSLIPEGNRLFMMSATDPPAINSKPKYIELSSVKVRM